MVCSVRGCEASRIMSFKEIRLTTEGEKKLAESIAVCVGTQAITSTLSSVPVHVDLNDYEVVFIQKVSGVNTSHCHKIANGALMRPHLPFNPHNLQQTISGTSVTENKSKTLKRCDILALPSAYQPNSNLMRQRAPSSNTALSLSSKPMQDFAMDQNQLDIALGENVFNQSSLNKSSSQSRNDRQRQINTIKSNDCSTPWRMSDDIQGATPTNTAMGNRYSWPTRLGLLSATLDENANRNYPENASLMTCLGLHAGSLWQYVICS